MKLLGEESKFERQLSCIFNLFRMNDSSRWNFVKQKMIINILCLFKKQHVNETSQSIFEDVVWDNKLNWDRRPSLSLHSLRDETLILYLLELILVLDFCIQWSFAWKSSLPRLLHTYCVLLVTPNVDSASASMSDPALGALFLLLVALSSLNVMVIVFIIFYFIFSCLLVRS